MADALNKHLNTEWYSSYLYHSMSSYASFKGLPGAAHWLYLQAQEELIHVQKFYDYIDSHGARLILEGIDKPPSEFGTLTELFEAVLTHEQLITKRVNELMSVACEEKDHATEAFLQWFVTEQTEEEKSVGNIISKLKLAGDTGPGIFMLDNELSKRTLATTESP